MLDTLQSMAGIFLAEVRTIVAAEDSKFWPTVVRIQRHDIVSIQ